MRPREITLSRVGSFDWVGLVSDQIRRARAIWRKTQCQPIITTVQRTISSYHFFRVVPERVQVGQCEVELILAPLGGAVNLAQQAICPLRTVNNQPIFLEPLNQDIPIPPLFFEVVLD